MKQRKDRNAVALGKRGGKVKSRAKRIAARKNGKRGGRPSHSMAYKVVKYSQRHKFVRATSALAACKKAFPGKDWKTAHWKNTADGVEAFSNDMKTKIADCYRPTGEAVISNATWRAMIKEAK